MLGDLTHRGWFRLRATDQSNTDVAAQLYLPVNTVKTHQRMIYRKLGADGRRDAVQGRAAKRATGG